MLKPTPTRVKKKEEDANEVYTRLFNIVDQSDGADLPSEIDLQGVPLEVAWSLWTAHRATKGKHLPFPGALLDQPSWAMNAIFLFDGLMDRVTQQVMEKKNGREQDP